MQKRTIKAEIWDKRDRDERDREKGQETETKETHNFSI